MSMLQRSIHISPPHCERCDGTWRVTATVGDAPLWFECDDFELLTSPEPFLTAFFVPALHQGLQLAIDANIDPEWIGRTKRLLPIYAQWWGYPQTHPVSVTSNAVPARGKNIRSARSHNRTAQCFTGGIDSFFSLLRGPHDPQYILYVQGFDVPLSDHDRAQALETSLSAVAAATNTTPIIVRTNLRQHPIFDAVSWERTHGAALAAVGMLLAEHIGGIVIPSSYAYEDHTPWGSHWDTDPLWSPPDQLQIIHDDASVTRRDKIVQLAAEPLVQRHLRVCWRNLTPTGNCSRCEKCLRTMATLEASGHLDAYHRVFDVETPLSKRLDDTSYLPHHLTFIWEDLATREVSPATRKAIGRLLRRSQWRAWMHSAKQSVSTLRSTLYAARRSIGHALFDTPDKP
jgi:hypothetical protein